MTYLDFVPLHLTGFKTKAWTVQTRSGGVELGTLRWYGPWRSYCYFPTRQQVLSPGCMDDVAAYCREQTTAHRARPRAPAPPATVPPSSADTPRTGAGQP